MLREFTLQPNEDKRLQVEGKYLVVTQATGPLELTIGGTTPITVDEKDRIHLRSESPNDRAIRIKNVSGGTNTIELHTSDLLVDKRTGTDIKNEIQIAEDQRIGIDPQSNIVQAVIQNPVKIDDKQNTVKLYKNTCVGIDGKKNKVEVIRKGKEYKALPAIIFTADPNDPPNQLIQQNIAANVHRDVAVVTADPNNAEPIWLGESELQGVPLFPGDRLFIEGENKLTFSAKSGHTMYAAEIVWKT